MSSKTCFLGLLKPKYPTFSTCFSRALSILVKFDILMFTYSPQVDKNFYDMFYLNYFSPGKFI